MAPAGERKCNKRVPIFVLLSDAEGFHSVWRLYCGEDRRADVQGLTWEGSIDGFPEGDVLGDWVGAPEGERLGGWVGP